MWNSFENNWIVIRIASRFSKRAQDLNFSCFWVLKYVGNFIGSNPFEPELDQNQGPVQSSGICLNWTIGPVHGSQKTLENRTEPNFGITNQTERWSNFSIKEFKSMVYVSYQNRVTLFKWFSCYPLSLAHVIVNIYIYSGSWPSASTKSLIYLLLPSPVSI